MRSSRGSAPTHRRWPTCATCRPRTFPSPVEPGFEIVASERGGAATAPVTPDSATCEECLAELADPEDRRYRYPFLNCTNCGPRFTIVRGIPYDRPLTTMANFEMCADCRAEYEDPLNRRFHAQPNACPVCGPRVWLVERDGKEVAVDGDIVRFAADELLAGKILAVKGLGGYHLACRADDEQAVAALRGRKRREDRPFALLVADLDAARELVELGPAEEALLTSRERPIVLATRKPDAKVAAAVAPNVPELGLMLPYTPLHQLLATDTGVPLVLTSGNVSDEPIAYDDNDAVQRLSAIADRFLIHNRPIATRTDDSVARAARGRPMLLRRSRGYVPASLDLPIAAPRPVLATGAEQKNAFCLAKGDRAWASHHIGDVKNYETLQSLRDGVAHFERLFEVTPEVVVHDLHPDYLSTRYAHEREEEGVELFSVQHHHAHLAATLAEHGERGPAVGAIYDGTGLGPDGTIWGGEILVGGLDSCDRAGRLVMAKMPGGDRAIKEPWRMACSWLTQMRAPLPPAFEDIPQQRWNMVARMAMTGMGSPVDIERRPALRRRRRAVRRAPRGDLRGPGRDRVRGARRSRRCRALPVPAGAERDDHPQPAPDDHRDARGPRERRPGRDDLRALPRRLRAGLGRCLRAGRRARWDRSRGAVRWRVSEPPAAEAHRDQARGGGAARARAREAAAQRRADRLRTGGDRGRDAERLTPRSRRPPTRS